MRLAKYILDYYKSTNEFATETGRNYPLVKRWCDKGAVVIDEQIYVPSVLLHDDSAPATTSLADHIAKQYDGNLSAAAEAMGRHRNQLATWCKRGALLIDGRIWLPKGLV